ncbi:hypothetical protein CEP73_002600 [Providencia stuartii]|nr:hypothetical protein CEP73_002600 [Providencia stuartii]
MKRQIYLKIVSKVPCITKCTTATNLIISMTVLGAWFLVVKKAALPDSIIITMQRTGLLRSIFTKAHWVMSARNTVMISSGGGLKNAYGKPVP